jgi:methylmalonyl-CoA mutase, C-terminal domain
MKSASVDFLKDFGSLSPEFKVYFTVNKGSRMNTSDTKNRNKIRVLIAKPGLDGHDRGAKVIARALRDAGFEVVYTGLHQTPEMIVDAAVQEDVHVVGLSILSGAHNALVPEVINGIRGSGITDVLYLVGGIIPEEDFEGLKKAGAQMVFTPGTSLEDIINYIDKHAPKR